MKKALLSFLMFGAILSASPVNVSFVSATSEIGPYTLNVNGQNTNAMCLDDFLQVQQNWTANVTNVSSSNMSNTYLGLLGATSGVIEGQTVTTSQAYKMEAYLFSQIIKPGADRFDIQKAAWAIMDPLSLQIVDQSNATAQNFIKDALVNYSSVNSANYLVVSDNGTSNCKLSQEFIVPTPEPASFALFGGGLLLAGAGRFFRRKKQVIA